MQTATSETESKSRDLSICVHHYTLRAPCPKGQGISNECTGDPHVCLNRGIRDLRQLRRGYRMWVISGSFDWIFKEATSTLRSFGMNQMWVGSLPHSLRISLQCDGVETPDGASDGAVCPRLRFWVDCRRRR